MVNARLPLYPRPDKEKETRKDGRLQPTGFVTPL